jgi:hypothetical protein
MNGNFTSFAGEKPQKQGEYSVRQVGWLLLVIKSRVTKSQTTVVTMGVILRRLMRRRACRYCLNTLP